MLRILYNIIFTRQFSLCDIKNNSEHFLLCTVLVLYDYYIVILTNFLIPPTANIILINTQD